MKRRRLLRFLVIVVLIALAWSYFSDPGPTLTIEPGTTLVLELRGEYVEAPASSILMRALGDDVKPFAGLLTTLSMAARDDRLDGVVLRIRNLGIGWAKAQELRDAIARLRENGRRTVAVMEIESFSAHLEYFVASAAEEVYFTPASVVPLVGLAAEYIYLGGLWERLGIDIEFARVGRYKSAVETLAETGMSESAREMVNSLLDSTNEQFLQGIADGRSLPMEEVKRAIDRGPVLPDEFVILGLIDGIANLDELEETQGATVKGKDYAQLDWSSVGFEPTAKFALIYGSGNVVSGRGSISRRGSRVFAAQTVAEALEEAAADPEIAAIIMRIDSPGGSSMAAETVWRAVESAKKSGKPVIASFSDVAASGGYYAVAGADAIVSGPATITGSIGVFALRPVVGELLDKLGIKVESLTRGRHADFLLSTSPLSTGARERLQSAVRAIYDLFIRRVAVGRAMEEDAVNAVAQGRVWTGAQALEEGLVDELGGLRTAVSRAKQALDLSDDTDVTLLQFPAPRSFADEIRELFGGGFTRVLEGRVIASLGERAPIPAVVGSLGGWLSDLPPDTPLLIPPLVVDID